MKSSRIFILVFVIVALALAGRHWLSKKEESKTITTVDTLPPVATATDTIVNAVEAVPSVPVPDVLNAHEKEQIQVLGEIFKSKNDNDPRMDQMLKNLSPAVKAALQKQYLNTKMELRNERGTIAFLIGRELKDGRGSPADVEFLKNVLMEKPCLSLMDCSKPASSQSVEEQHLEGIHETTAHYPQLMDLRYLKQSLESGNLSPEMRAAVIAALEAAHHSPNSRVVDEAQAILDSLP